MALAGRCGGRLFVSCEVFCGFGGRGLVTWYCAAVPQLVRRCGSLMRDFRPWAPKAPRTTEAAPERLPMVQNIEGDVIVMEIFLCW